MAQRETRSIPLENLLLDLENPRYEPATSQRGALLSIAKEQDIKLFNLAEDIVARGLNPTEFPLVMQSEDEKIFVVLEGNRRIAAMKLALSPSLASSLDLPPIISNKFKSLYEDAKDKVNRQISCVVLTREEANHWIELRHTGQNEGAGIVPWNAAQTHRFRNTPARQVLDLVAGGTYLDDETRKKLPKTPITNIERILGTTEARAFLGVDVKKKQLVFIAPEEEVIARLSLIVADVANGRVTVPELEDKGKRIAYAEKIAKQPLPTPFSKSPSGATTGGTTPSAPKKPAARKNPVDRKTLIPPKFILAINQSRINKIYDELQHLPINQYANCCAVMLRVFLELSLDEFAQRKNINFKIYIPPKNQGDPATLKILTLQEKLITVRDYLLNNRLCTKAELTGVDIIIKNKNHILCIDTLHQYVHNKDYHPDPTSLKITWDNLAVFFVNIWKI